MNFLVFWPNTFIISKIIHLLLVELIKDEATLKLRYYDTIVHFDFTRPNLVTTSPSLNDKMPS
jgi:hypothetical protein